MVEAVNRQLQGVGGGVAAISDGGLVGGYFVWVKLPERVRATDVARVAKEQEALAVPPGPLFGVAWDEQEMDLEGFLRLSFSYGNESNSTEGAVRLGAVVGKLLDTSDKMAPANVDSRNADSTGFDGRSDL